MQSKSYKLRELIKLTGFSERSIRHYVTLGLISGADGKGPNAAYSKKTLDRLKRIKQLKSLKLDNVDRRLSLKEIKYILDTDSYKNLWNKLISDKKSSAIALNWSETVSKYISSSKTKATQEEAGQTLTFIFNRILDLIEDTADDNTVSSSKQDYWKLMQTPDYSIGIKIPQTKKQLADLRKEVTNLRSAINKPNTRKNRREQSSKGDD